MNISLFLMIRTINRNTGRSGLSMSWVTSCWNRLLLGTFCWNWRFLDISIKNICSRSWNKPIELSTDPFKKFSTITSFPWKKSRNPILASSSLNWILKILTLLIFTSCQGYVSVGSRRCIKIRLKSSNLSTRKKLMRMWIVSVAKKRRLFKPISSSLGRTSKKCRFCQE